MYPEMQSKAKGQPAQPVIYIYSIPVNLAGWDDMPNPRRSFLAFSAQPVALAPGVQDQRSPRSGE